jgi:hypothetical protein
LASSTPIRLCAPDDDPLLHYLSVGKIEVLILTNMKMDKTALIPITVMRIGAMLDSFCHAAIGVVPVNTIDFNLGDGCSSPVGRQPYFLQAITLKPNCADVGGIVHEIGHTVGLFHEHTRSDRDNYVTILWNNILDDAKHNFEIDPGSVNLGPYDYASIMHYDAFAFSKNGQPTIVTKPAGIPIGQRNGLSQGDINAVAMLYR